MFSYAPKKTAGVERPIGSGPINEARGRAGVSNELAQERLRGASADTGAYSLSTTETRGGSPLTDAPKKKVDDASMLDEENPGAGRPAKKKLDDASMLDEENPGAGRPAKKKVGDASTLDDEDRGSGRPAKKKLEDVSDATTLSGPPKRKVKVDDE